MKYIYISFVALLMIPFSVVLSQGNDKTMRVKGVVVYNAGGEIFHSGGGITISGGGKIENKGRLSIGADLKNENNTSEALVNGPLSSVYFVGDKSAKVQGIFDFQTLYAGVSDTIHLDNSANNTVKGLFFIDGKSVVTSKPGINIKSIKSNEYKGKGELYLPANEKSYSQLITASSNLTSNIRMEQYYPNAGWYWVSFPTVPDLNQFKSGGIIVKNRSAYTYDPAKGVYSPVDASTPLSATDGLKLFFGSLSNGKVSFFDPSSGSNKGIIDVSGPANSGSVNHTVKYHSASTNTVSGYPAGTPHINKSGWNLVANPYPSSLDWRKVSKGAFITEAMYTTNRNTGAISSYANGLYTNEATSCIRPFSGFFIRSLATDSIQFDNRSRAFDCDEQKEAGGYYDIIRLTSKGSSYPDVLDDMVVAFKAEATDAYDTKYDALKVFNPNTNAHNVYSTSGSGEALYAINVLKKKEQALVPVYFTSQSDQEEQYEIFANLDKTNDAWVVRLEDLKTGYSYDMRNITPYSYKIAPGDPTHRFNLLVNMTETQTSNKSLETLNVWTDTDGIHLYMKPTNNELLSEVYDVQVFTSYGTLIHEMQISPGTDYLYKPSKGLTHTIYLVKITVDQAVKVNRVIY